VGETTTWQINVRDGYVIQTRIKSTNDASVTQFFPTGIKDGAGKPVWHAIEEDEAVYVQYNVAKDGMITGEPSVTVDEDNIDHVHYFPEAFDFAGANGGAYIKLAVFKLIDGKPKLEKFCAGSHIHHYAERSTWENFPVETEGTIRNIGKTYDSEADKYQIKPLVQLPVGVPIIMPLGAGVTDQDAESINFRTLKENDEAPQIRVSAEPEDGSILIRGNGAIGSLIHEDCDGNPTTLISWSDGLITTTGDATFVAGCDGSGGGRVIP